MERKWLIDLRNDKNMTQEQVAESAGISRPYYTAIENGKRGVPVHTAQRIASALDIDWQRFYEASAAEVK